MADTAAQLATRPYRRRLILVGVVAVVLAAVTAAILTLRAEPAPSPATERPLVVGPAGVSPERQELLRLLTAGRSRPSHARYSTAEGGRLELWRSGSRYRQDTEVRDPDGAVVRSVSIHGRQGDVACRRTGDDPWTCSRAPAPPEPETLVVGDLAGRTVVARDESIRGRPARCFTISGPDQSAEVCFDRRGTLLVLATGSARLELEDVDDSVDPKVFEPPGRPAG